MMTKFLTKAVILAALISVFTLSVSAANYENSAETLHSLGLFQGTANGYELDAAPTRVQAGVMLIRLLGQEEAALAGSYSHPFTDVAPWSEKYVGYLYENGLTNGISETEFGSANACDLKMFTTFALRALGYDDAKGDFSYAEAVDFGMERGIVEPLLTKGDFLRDQMAAVSLMSLMAQPKDQSADTLLEKLVEDGAVPADAAAPVLSRYAAYDEYMALSAAYNDAKTMDVDLTMDAVMSMMGTSIPMAGDMHMRLDIRDGMKFAVLGDFSVVSEALALDETFDFEMYYKDGYFYMDMAGEKVKLPMDLDASMELSMNMMSTGSADLSLLSVNNVVKTTEAGNTVYAVDYSAPFFSAYIDSVLSDLLAGDLAMEGMDLGGTIDFTINALSTTAVFDAAGVLKSQSISMDVDMFAAAEGQTMAFSLLCDMDMTINSIGAEIAILYPADLSDYSDMAA